MFLKFMPYPNYDHQGVVMMVIMVNNLTTSPV
jgi:hypothetical protein